MAGLLAVRLADDPVVSPAGEAPVAGRASDASEFGDLIYPGESGTRP